MTPTTSKERLASYMGNPFGAMPDSLRPVPLASRFFALEGTP